MGRVMANGHGPVVVVVVVVVVVYMFFFAESTLPGTHRQDVIWYAF